MAKVPYKVDEEAYGMDCRPGPSRYPLKSEQAIMPDYIKAGIAKRQSALAADKAAAAAKG